MRIVRAQSRRLNARGQRHRVLQMAETVNQHHSRSVGEQLRRWRQRRRMSQLDLAGVAEVSTRHLSFVETGRAEPSRELLLRLCERLAVPSHDGNALLLAAGFAPMFQERMLDTPVLRPIGAEVERILNMHAPYPALAVDRHWNIVLANKAMAPLLQGVAAFLMEPPVNMMRISLHPRGMASRILNFDEWRTHLLSRLHVQLVASADPMLAALLRELADLSPPLHDTCSPPHRCASIAVPLLLRTDHGVLNFISTTTVLGSRAQTALAELALEFFFPADDATAQALGAAPEFALATSSEVAG